MEVASPDFIPREPEDINAEWLFQMINQYRRAKDLSLIQNTDDLIKCEITERPSSHGFYSSTYQINVAFKCFTVMGIERLAYSFFLKLLPSANIRGTESSCKFVKAAKYFENEVQAYFYILSVLKRVWTGARMSLMRKVSTNHLWTCLDIAAPEIVYGAHNKSGDGLLVLIDHTAEGYSPIGHYRGLSLNQIMTTVEYLSAVHATAAAALFNRTEPYEAMKKLFDSDLASSHRETGIVETTQILKQLARFLKAVPGYRDQGFLLDRFRPGIAALMVDYISKTETSFPLRTIIHGELWDKNLLFRQGKLPKPCGPRPPQREVDFAHPPAVATERSISQTHPGHEAEEASHSHQDDEDLRLDDENVSLEVMLTDWKKMALSSPCFDLAMLLYSSTSQSLRDKHGRQILEKYYFSFTEILRSKFDIKLSHLCPDFDFDVFLNDYERCHVAGFLQAACLMTSELRFLESEFAFSDTTSVAERNRAGEDLRLLGRRLLELLDEFLPQIGPAIEAMTDCGCPTSSLLSQQAASTKS